MQVMTTHTQIPLGPMTLRQNAEGTHDVAAAMVQEKHFSPPRALSVCTQRPEALALIP